MSVPSRLPKQGVALREGVAEFLVEWHRSGEELRDWTNWDVGKLDMLRDSVGLATHVGCPGGFCRLTLAGHWVGELLA